MLLIAMQKLPLFVHVPLAAYNYYRISNKRHLFDATEIFRVIRRHQIEAIVKLVLYLLTFFYFLFRMIMTIVG